MAQTLVNIRMDEVSVDPFYSGLTKHGKIFMRTATTYLTKDFYFGRTLDFLI